MRHCGLRFSNGCTEACQLLLDDGTPVITGTVSIWEVFDNIMDGASENGNVEITQMLIQHGYPVNETTAWYAMKNAARTGQTADYPILGFTWIRSGLSCR